MTPQEPAAVRRANGLESVLQGSPYQGYSYSYPHKTAYRSFERPLPLRDVWREENTDSLFLYLHVPFCEHRCGFCNLFTQANPEDGLTARYLRQLKAECEQVAESIDEPRFARMAIGGGTPTFLSLPELATLFQLVQDHFGVLLDQESLIPTSIEVSPPTIDREKLELLSSFHVERISIGVQSFLKDEVRGIGRPQKPGEAHAALSLIREFPFPRLNIDLIYGGEGQTVDSWLSSIDQALRYTPEELYLYPLYVRPLTGLGRLGQNRSDAEWDEHRLALYREGRSKLLAAGYRQVSMRMFERADLPASSGPDYCCQTDGMIGIGCGSRSYTQTVHYSTEYAVGKTGVQSIIADYLKREPSAFASARYGYRLPVEDQQRRFVLQSLLQTEGLDQQVCSEKFGRDVVDQLPQLIELAEFGLAEINAGSIQLTPAGLERSDAIGPWLYSPQVRELMGDFELH
jgi:oxygen-independent coproporphyrinogen III oxidase